MRRCHAWLTLLVLLVLLIVLVPSAALATAAMEQAHKKRKRKNFSCVQAAAQPLRVHVAAVAEPPGGHEVSIAAGPASVYVQAAGDTHDVDADHVRALLVDTAAKQLSGAACAGVSDQAIESSPLQKLCCNNVTLSRTKMSSLEFMNVVTHLKKGGVRSELAVITGTPSPPVIALVPWVTHAPVLGRVAAGHGFA